MEIRQANLGVYTQKEELLEHIDAVLVQHGITNHLNNEKLIKSISFK